MERILLPNFLSDFLILALKLSKFFLHFQIFLATAISQYNIFFFSYDIYVYNISKFSSTISNFRETHGDSTYEFPRLELYYTIISFPKFFVSNYQQMKKTAFLIGENGTLRTSINYTRL